MSYSLQHLSTVVRHVSRSSPPTALQLKQFLIELFPGASASTAFEQFQPLLPAAA